MASEDTKEAFAAADTNGDGRISYEEFEEALGVLKHTCASACCHTNQLLKDAITLQCAARVSSADSDDSLLSSPFFCCPRTECRRTRSDAACTIAMIVCKCLRLYRASSRCRTRVPLPPPPPRTVRMHLSTRILDTCAGHVASKDLLGRLFDQMDCDHGSRGELECTLCVTVTAVVTESVPTDKKLSYKQHPQTPYTLRSHTVPTSLSHLDHARRQNAG